MIAPLIADGGEMTVLRQLATFTWGTWSVTWPEGIEPPELPDEREFGFVSKLSEPKGRFARRFDRADVSIDVENEFSDVEFVLDEAAGRMAGDAFFERDITNAGLGRQVPLVDFSIGDVVPVRVWGKIIDLPVTSIERVSEVGNAVGWRVHVGGQLLGDSVGLDQGNREIYRQIAQERRERIGDVDAVDQKAEAAKSTAETAKQIAEQSKEASDAALTGTILEYAVGTSEEFPPTSGWSTATPQRPSGSFIWMRTRIAYGSGQSEVTSPVLVTGNTGAPGADGTDGTAGKDGLGIQSTAVLYAVGTSGTTAPTSGWSSQVPPLIQGQYLWTRTIWTYTDDSTETGYSVTYLSKDGNNGNDGLPGKDGVGIKSTTITYAKSTSGTTAPTTGWASQPPVSSPGDYVWTRTVWSYSDGTTETGYSVGRIGPKGDKGDTGSAGKGISSTATAYAAAASGTATPTTGWTTSIPVVPKGHFLWTRTTITFTDQATSVSYSVSRQGVDGENGTPGNPGADGRTSYFHTAYANSADGVAGFSTTDPTGRTYVGTYSDFTEADSPDPSRYTWQLVKGTDGAPGKGVDTVTITYASSSSGTQAPTTGWQTTMPEVPQGHFLWTRTLTRFTDGATTTVDMVARQGVDGQKGTPGVPGHDGRTPFLHVAYANSADGTVDFSTTDPSGRAYLGTYTDFATLDIHSDVYTDSYGTSTPLDSTDPARYSWALIKGMDGADGISVAGMTIYYRLVSRDSPTPSRPTVDQPSGWTTTEPDYQSGTTLYQVIKVTYSNGAFAYTDVSRVSAYMAAASAIELAEDGVKRAKDINAALTGSIDGDLTAAMADSETAIGAVADAATVARDWTVENQQDFNNTVALANAAQAKVNDVNLINWETQDERNALQTEIDEAQNVALRLQENAIKWSSILAVRQVSSPNLVLYPHLNFNDYGWVIITKTNLGQVWVSPKDAWAGTMTVHYVNASGQSVIHRYTRTDPNSIPSDWGLSESQASGQIRDVHVILTPWRWRAPREFVFPYSRGGTAFDPVATYDEVPYGPVRNADSSYKFEFAVRTDRPVMLSPSNGATWFQAPTGSEITAGYWVLPVSYADGPARRVVTFTEVSTG